MDYYRGVKIAGEDVVEEENLPESDMTLDALAGYDDETKALFAGGLGDDPLVPEEPLGDAE